MEGDRGLLVKDLVLFAYTSKYFNETPLCNEPDFQT